MRIGPALLTSIFALGMAVSAESAEYVKVEVQGKLNSQVAAIGGETTGVIITAGGVTWELDLGQNKPWRKLAAELHQKQVLVTGELTIKRGVEIHQRSIVKVASFQAAGVAPMKQAYLTAEGKLAHALSLRDAQGGFAGFSGHLWTIEPDGSWRREPFLNRNVRAADMKGQFTKEQLAALEKYLTKHDLLGLPERIGKPVGANPHVFTIAFGEKQTALTVGAGAPLPEVDPRNAASDHGRFATIAQLLLRGMKARAEEK